MDSPIVMLGADDNYPTDYWSAYLTHGTVTWIFGFWMFLLSAAWSS